MPTKLYVGNLSFDTTENDLQDYFASVGGVKEVALIQDKFTGRSRGFAFVTMDSREDAEKAIQQFNGQSFQGRPLVVNEARPMDDRPPRSGGAGSSGGHRGGGGNRGCGAGGGHSRQRRY